jgi:hypothetical protein
MEDEAKKRKHNSTVSGQLTSWLKTDSTPTIQEFNQTFSEEGMALIILILISPSALPIPTAGLTHLFQLVVVVISFQILIGRNQLWLPKKMKGIRINDFIKLKIMPGLINLLKKIEVHSSKSTKFKSENWRKLDLAGAILVIIFTTAAFFAPPFSMLDTLPSLAVVTIALSLINHTRKTFFLGLSVGLLGLTLELFFSASIILLIKSIAEKLF